ncbi:MAG: transposase [Bacteroidetes bacterium]|nr:transposase [Bacteroidota bacterium]
MLDEKIRTLIREDENLYGQQQLLKSIPGIGDITSVYILMTKGFTAFTSGRNLRVIQVWRPSSILSGTSIKGKPESVTPTDKKMKTLLHMASYGNKYDPETQGLLQQKKQKESILCWS